MALHDGIMAGGVWEYRQGAAWVQPATSARNVCGNGQERQELAGNQKS